MRVKAVKIITVNNTIYNCKLYVHIYNNLKLQNFRVLKNIAQILIMCFVKIIFRGVYSNNDNNNSQAKTIGAKLDISRICYVIV